MGILDKLATAREATGGSTGGSRNFTNKSGLWVNLDEGDNRVRLGGNLVVCERHYVVDLVTPDALKPKSSEEKALLSKNATCLNWDIDHQCKIDEELQCCPLCDLRTASNVRRREAKEAKNKELEDKMKDVSGKAYARSRYSWDAIDRANPLVKTIDADGNETEAPGWKILNLGSEGTEALEALAKQYSQIADENEGCDVVIAKHKSNRITYGASFALNGPNIHVTPLTEEEKTMERVDLLRYVASNVSPRALFESLKPGYQEIITEVLGKTADDYPSEPPVKKTIRTNEGDVSEEDSTTAPPKRAATPAAKAPVRKRAASVADEFEDVSSTGDEDSSANNETFAEEKEEKKTVPASPKLPKPPQPPKPPKAAPKIEEEPVEEESAEEEPEEEPAAEESAEEDVPQKETKKKVPAEVKPECFGNFEDNDKECAKCSQAELCAANPEA